MQRCLVVKTIQDRCAYLESIYDGFHLKMSDPHKNEIVFRLAFPSPLHRGETGHVGCDPSISLKVCQHISLFFICSRLSCYKQREACCSQESIVLSSSEIGDSMKIICCRLLLATKSVI